MSRGNEVVTLNAAKTTTTSRNLAAHWVRRALGLEIPDPTHSLATLHDHDEQESFGLIKSELRQLRRIRLMGGTGTVLMALGAVGVGVQPVLQNPVAGIRALNLFSRMQTTSLSLTWLGMGMLVLAWLLLGRFAAGDLRRSHPTRQLSRSQFNRTLLLWILPLTIAPPMFSKDVYSYLAQSEIARRGMDPYLYGPAQALGIDNVLARTVPTIWRDTAAPYGPLFLWIGKGISAITGDNIVAGIFLHRLVALGGVGLMIWAVPRLARRCHVSETSALWLGVANPLVLFHLVAGIHNEALMLGLMLAGLVLAIEAVESSGSLRGSNLAMLIGGCSLIVLASMVKIPALAGLGFIGMALTRRSIQQNPHRKLWSLLASIAIMGGVVAIVVLAVTWASGIGMGWLHTVNTASAVRSWLSLPTTVGVVTGFGGVLLGLGDHTDAVLSIVKPIAACVAAFVMLRMLLAVYTGRLPVIGALGIAFGAMVLLFPVVQPWYLLWAVLPLAAWATLPAFRIPAIVFSASVSMLVMPNGAEFQPWQIIEACVISLVALSVIALPAFRTNTPDDDPLAGDHANFSTSTPNTAALRPEKR